MKLFRFIIDTPDPEITLSTQWIYDIMVEFTYQFQGFSQYRSQVSHRSPEELRKLEANRNIWTFPVVQEVLKDMIRVSGIKNKSTPQTTTVSSVKQQFGYFACLELARLECLVGDYEASVKALSYIDLFDRSELFDFNSSCRANVFYFAGISMLMMRRFTDAIDIFSNVLMYISRITKPGAQARSEVSKSLSKINFRLVGLTAIASALCPSHRLDEQVREILSSKSTDKSLEKTRKINEGDLSAFRDVFESCCPKYIFPSIPEFTHQDSKQDALGHQVNVFMVEVAQNVAVLKLRSYLRLYAAIELPKLARFNDKDEADFTDQLISFAHKAVQVESTSAAPFPSGVSKFTSDVHYVIEDGNVIIDARTARSDKGKAVEKDFMSGVRKHAEIVSDINIAFCELDL